MLRKLIPLADRVLVKRILPQTKTLGGVFLPDTNVGKSNEGEVLAVGEGLRTVDGKLIPLNLNAGDKVLLPDFDGVQVKSEGEEVYLFRYEQILAKISK